MKNLFKKLFKSNAIVNPRCPSGSRIYCIGDIHGRDDLLQQLHAFIIEDAAGYPGNKTLVYLGDYIDRGDDSREVIERLQRNSIAGFESIYLRGNHEQTLLDFLREPEVGRSWFNYGGLQTLISYGVRPAKLATRKQDLMILRDELKANMPEKHVQFFESTRSHHVAGSYYFVHAGVNPRVKLEAQRLEDQLWIREAFIEHTRAYEKIIVHGHTISDEPDFQPNRIGLDTGAYLSGKLSCLVLEADRQRVLQTHA